MRNNEFIQIIQKRPGMYLGDKGIEGLIYHWLVEISNYINEDNCVFTISLLKNNNFSIKITNHSKSLLDLLLAENNNFTYTVILFAVSKKYKVSALSKHTSLEFQIDQKYIKQAINYLMFIHQMTQFVMLFRNVELLIKDKRKKYLSQTYLNTPEGVFFLYNNVKNKNTLNNIEFLIDEFWDEDAIQIAVTYNRDYIPEPSITSFMNEEYTSEGGSHVNGIIKGMLKAWKKHIKENKLEYLIVNKHKILVQLILICAVKTKKEIQYLGATKTNLYCLKIEKNLENLVANKFYNYICKNPSITESFIKRFDENNYEGLIYKK